MSNEVDVDGRYAVVTGGARWIGRAIAERFLDSGLVVAIWDRNRPPVDRNKTEFMSRGWIIAFGADVVD